MDILGFLQKRGSPPDPTDELLYEFVAAELANSNVKQGLWTKALSDAEWDEPRAKSLYVKMRVQQLRIELAQTLAARHAQLADPSFQAREEAREFGLSPEEIAYLDKPIKAIRYLVKYHVSEKSVSNAIGSGKLRSVLCHEVLWVQDKRIA